MPTLLHHCTIPYNQCPVWWLLDEYTPTPNTLNPFCPLYICWTDIFYPMLPSVCTIQDFRLLSHLPLVIQINIQSLSVSTGDRPNVKQRHHHETSLLQNVALMTAGWKKLLIPHQFPASCIFMPRMPLIFCVHHHCLIFQEPCLS